MLVRFTQRASIPGQALYMVNEVVTLSDDVAQDFIERGIAVAYTASPAVSDKAVSAPPADKMVKTGHRK